MIENVAKPTISALLDPESPVVFRIPRYQREYTWKIKDWENLFDDVMENPTGYFLGSIIVIDHGHDPETGITELEVIDGQQRLTTISILLTAFYSIFKEHKNDFLEDDEIYSTYLNLKNRLLLKGKKGMTKVVPQVQSKNLEDYRALLSEFVGLDYQKKKKKKAGLRKIYRAYRYFHERILQKIDNSEDFINEALDLLKKINSSVLVQISVSSHSDAYVLFESLNNRGTPLTAVDLIKNTLLAKLAGTNDAELDNYFDKWQYMLMLLGDDYKTQERFFRQSYDAFRRDVNLPFVKGDAKFPLGAVATKSNLLSIYEAQIGNDPFSTLDWLISNAQIYSKIIRVSDDDIAEILEDSLFDLANVQGVPSYLLLLNLMKRSTELNLNDVEIAEVCSLLTKFFVRRNLTDTPPTRDLTRLFIRTIEELDDKKLKGKDLVLFVRERLIAVSSSDEVFENKLRGSVYESNPDTVRFILATLAKPSVTKEMKGLWDRYKSGNYVWTIEHILPQGRNIPDSWVKMIANGDIAKAEEIQHEHVHTLGNLTLTGYNSTLSNLSFIDKKNRKDKYGNQVGYLNGLNINEDVARHDFWTAKDIEERTELLVSKVLDLFSM